MKWPSCYHENPSGLKFCGEWGTKLGPEAEAARISSPDSCIPKRLAEKPSPPRKNHGSEVMAALSQAGRRTEGNTLIADYLDLRILYGP
jgi:hypothetical protein